MMDYSKLKFQRLERDSTIAEIECAEKDLTEFLHKDAMNYQDELLSVTYLVYYDGRLAAYFSLLNDVVRLEETEKRVRNRINRKIPFSKQRNHYAAVKLGRLAVDKNFSHQGIGETILKVIPMMFLPRNKTGCRFITVDALSSATGFYETKGGFRFYTEQDEGDDTRLMYFDLKDFK